MTPTPTQALEPVEVTQADTVLFLEHAFRNIDLPPLSADDVKDIRDGLARAIERHRQSSNAASVGVDAAKAALAKLGWRIENRGGSDIRVGEDWCSPATDSDTLMFNALSGIASLSTPSPRTEDGWLPIDTAPRDGTWFIGDGGGCERPTPMKWNNRIGAWECDAVMLEDWGDQVDGYSRPERWRPIPAAAKEGNHSA